MRADVHGVIRRELEVVTGRLSCLLGACVLLLAGAIALPTSARAAGPVAHAAMVGPAPGSEQLPIIIPLKADDAGLRAFASAVSTPGSALYGRFESIPTLARRFGANAQTRRRVIAFLRSHGATHVSVDPSGLLAHATMTVAAAQLVFDVPLARFRADDGSRFVAPATQVRLPAALRGLVEGVVGLDTAPVASVRAATLPARESPFANPTSPIAYDSAMSLSGTPAGCAGALASGSFTPNQYLAAYDYDPLRAEGLNGQGERLALVEIDGIRGSDLNAFANCYGIDRPAYTTYAVGGLDHFLAPGPEATLDFEIADAVAPELSQIEMFETANSDAGILAAIAAPLFIPGDKPAVISDSIGECEPDYIRTGDVGAIKASDRELELMAAVGISFVAAAGDNGSADCNDEPGDHRLAVDYPASSPWTTGVGGTNLDLNAANQIVSQEVWNDGSSDPDFGGGGGFSVLEKRPAYQDGVVAGHRRTVPDVAMLADVSPGFAIYCTAKPPGCDPQAPWSDGGGGTSFAAPMFGAGLELIDQDLARHERELVGFANPLLYRMGKSALRDAVFDEVTIGTNDTGPSFGDHEPLGCCSAGPNFNQAAGWGSVNLANLDGAAESLLPMIANITLTFPGGQRPVHARRLAAALGCSSACNISAFLNVSITKGAAFQVVAPVFFFHRARTQRFYFHFTARQDAELRAALAEHRSIFAEAFADTLDDSGHVTAETPARQVLIRS